MQIINKKKPTKRAQKAGSRCTFFFFFFFPKFIHSAPSPLHLLPILYVSLPLCLLLPKFTDFITPSLRLLPLCLFNFFNKCLRIQKIPSIRLPRKPRVISTDEPTAIWTGLLSCIFIRYSLVSRIYFQLVFRLYPPIDEPRAKN